MEPRQGGLNLALWEILFWENEKGWREIISKHQKIIHALKTHHAIMGLKHLEATYAIIHHHVCIQNGRLSDMGL